VQQNPSLEEVLVFPTARLKELGEFQGISTDVGRYFDAIVTPPNCHFIPRAEAEVDPSRKQIIPYVILRHRDAVFFYVRGERSGEARLRRLGSIGVGGHINPIDLSSASDGSFYGEAVRREVDEEVGIDSPYHQRVVAAINDDSTPVGSVHFGIVHVFDLAEPRVVSREDKLVESGFADIAVLRQRKAEFETWSVLCLDALAGGAIAPWQRP
jgi:predicted NUDIX family phosphoesterase